MKTAPGFQRQDVDRFYQPYKTMPRISQDANTRQTHYYFLLFILTPIETGVEVIELMAVYEMTKGTILIE
ncbi:hypothetical protein OH492_18745 [Vibrio chagasii]|nr:hypothetical protein [Vibrio chagasii]